MAVSTDIPLTTDIDVIVIGAGLAGLGAAATLRAGGLSSVVLEASARVGGRAWTTQPEALGGAWFDHGAAWLHAVTRNPLVPIAEAAGEILVQSDQLRTERTFIGGRAASAREAADYGAAWPRFTAAADALLGEVADAPLAAVAARLPDDPWAVTVETWEGPIINVADADAFSLRDWRRNVLEGPNLMIQGGIGAFVARHLAPMAGDIRLQTPVTRIAWQGSDGSVTVTTPRGRLRAQAVIVTVSTGVLASGAIAFDPPLPVATQADLHALPMGLAIKAVFRATGPDRLGLPDHCSLDRQLDRSGAPMMVFSCWPLGRDFISGWTGGSHTWELSRSGPRAIEDFARAELRRIFGGRADASLVFAFATDWGGDKNIRGAYAYACPGQVDARRRLGVPLADGQLVLAGEATCDDGLAGTLGGAWNSGVRAAQAAAKIIPGR